MEMTVMSGGISSGLSAGYSTFLRLRSDGVCCEDVRSGAEKRSATRWEGSSPGPSAPDAVGSVETRRGSRLRDVGERSRGKRREIRRFPVIPRAFPSHASGFRV